MNYKLEYGRDGLKKDITKQCGNVSWTDSEDTLGVAFSFEFAKVKGHEIQNGDIIYFENLESDQNVFTGIVTSLDRGYLTDSIRCYDFAFYLNKSETIIQFNGVSATAALKALFRKVGIPYKDIPQMSTRIWKIFKGKVISEIIREILELVYLETGKRYKIAMTGMSLTIAEVSIDYTKAYASLASNLPRFDITKAVDKSSRLTESIEELKNAITIVSGDESNTIIEHAKDHDSIKKYGLLEKVMTAPDKDEAQSRQSAKVLLKALNKVIKTSSIKLMGNDSVRAGQVIELFVPIIGLVGFYKVKNITHVISGGVYTMSLNVEGM